MGTPARSVPVAVARPALGPVSLLQLPCGRARRVLLLVAGIVVLSLADLHITLTYLWSVGMGEANPIARYLMQTNSSSALVAWKLASVALASLIFVTFRGRRSTELAAWGCFLLLVWLTLRWIAYSDDVGRLTPALNVISQADSTSWVSMPE